MRRLDAVLHRGLLAHRSRVTEVEQWAALLREVASYYGVRVRVTSIVRSEADQIRLLRAGLTQTKVSTHLYGLAFDAVAEPRRYQTGLGLLAEALGLWWGGRFHRPDPVHFQIVDPAAWAAFVRETEQGRLV